MASSGILYDRFMQRPPASFNWDRKFTIRQEYAYSTIDNRLEPEPGQDLVSAFFEAFAGILDPPQYNCALLRNFLRSANHAALKNASLMPEKSMIVDDRRDTTVGVNSTRDWSSDFYRKRPQKGDDVFSECVNVCELHTRLKKHVSL